MHAKAKYHWISLLPMADLITISTTGVVPYDLAVKHRVLQVPAEALPRIKGTATYYLNQRKKGTHARTPAQNRGALLGSAKFALTGIRGQACNLGHRLMDIHNTDLTASEVYEFQMQVNWLLSEVDIALSTLSKLSASKISALKVQASKTLTKGPAL